MSKEDKRTKRIRKKVLQWKKHKILKVLLFVLYQTKEEYRNIIEVW